ncbi:glycosyltransferase family 4 protein [Flavobacterium sp. EDS]|uniref:glycosyltransferase n=1 Tax=Flavobacterium sp. EDS TaxID=2897328 RepID=UPI001E5A4754|nr:glycosyltransferase [Flavobacterium sp. EDS]MCD0474829.1 glycosyltransferase family 4 protein [Flavobacterium sp. EDS]
MRILYFYPENPLMFTQGNNARALSLLRYFKSRNIKVDFVGEESDDFKEDSILEMKSIGLIAEGFLLKRGNRKSKRIKYLLTYSLPRKMNRSVKDFDRTKFEHKEQFAEIIESRNYDYKIISYAYWASLLDNTKKGDNEKWIIDTHDFLTSQFQTNKKFSLSDYFQTEISVLKKFDRVWVISNEEKYVFSQFLDNQLDLITHSLPNNAQDRHVNAKNIDVVYVASENEHNVKSARWFFENVYPNIKRDIKITVIGKIAKYIPEFENVEKIKFIEDLDGVYKKAKIAICPMLSGTGLKIKVVESLSYGLPVVCNERGIDGLLNKTNNGCLVTNCPLEFANYINKLLQEEEFYEAKSLEASKFFIENFDINSTHKVLDDIFFADKKSHSL